MPGKCFSLFFSFLALRQSDVPAEKLYTLISAHLNLDAVALIVADLTGLVLDWM